ncbi:MAG: Ig-like domain-containing protein [Bacilli bacterium]|nr:Ig-like domain-containing protein [Bacilli bacterium]
MRRIIAFIILVILVIVMIVLSYNFYSKNNKKAKSDLDTTLKVTKKKTDDIEIKTNKEDEEEDKEYEDEKVEGDLSVEEDVEENHPVPDTASNDEDGYIRVESYDVSPSKTVLKVGETGKIDVAVYPKNASEKEITFVSSNPKVLKVDSFGKMKALKTGEVTVTVKVSGQKDSSFIVSVK